MAGAGNNGLLILAVIAVVAFIILVLSGIIVINPP